MVPFGHLDLAFCPVDNCLAEGDREADGRVVDLIVVCVLVDKTSKVVGVKLEMSGEDAGQSEFVVVSLGGLNGQS
jgi:hypothetical protein